MGEAMTEPSRPDNAGVRLIPPLVYVAGLLIGYLVWWLWPVPIIPGQDGLARILGGLFVIAGAAAMVSALATFHRIGTAVVPVRPASALALAGPYRFTRNPMYLGLAAAHAGIALIGNALWPLIALIPVIWLIQTQVIAREEAYLERRFGGDYQRYRTRVRRWL
jgi:protein-S-isoprenylcysteine O-methyltransferase Ste14